MKGEDVVSVCAGNREETPAQLSCNSAHYQFRRIPEADSFTERSFNYMPAVLDLRAM